MVDESQIVSWVDQLRQHYGDRRLRAYEQEKPAISEYLQILTEHISETFSLDEPLAVGGTGIVFKGTHDRLAQPVVIKFNRPNVPAEEKPMVENETKILPQLNHPNIIGVLDIGNLSGGTQPILNYLVEPFIEGSTAFHTSDKDRVEKTWLWKQIEQVRNRLPDVMDEVGQTAEFINTLLADIATLFSQWVSFLAYLHEKQYIYLDVKPENVLVDNHNHLTAIDFGSVQRLDEEDHQSINVFFTERYAHEILIARKKEKTSSNRVRGGIKRSELSRSFDYYALGVSLLEVLNEVAILRDHLVPQLPLYRSLHFLATRLLDGQNTAKEQDNEYTHANQVFPGLQSVDYEDLKYTNLNDVERDLRKERGGWNIEEQVPELASYSKSIVRLVPGFNTVLTDRLRGIIEHPLVARLKYVTQLGLASLTYPTADHARYDHTLGTYTYTTMYVKSLFHDLGNPIFRNLVGVEDIKGVLLASLLHDLGQYPLAHDLEEVHEGIFKHLQIGFSLLEDDTKDRHGRSLQDLITELRNGWGVQIDSLRRILGAHSRNISLFDEGDQRSFKTDVLAAIIDGPIDADKADYIIRDSSRCELPYGGQLDLERLFRVLTVASISDSGGANRRVTLGVYDKGIASAHAFGQARYQLLATVYWHHTVRITKAMLQYATAMALPLEVFGPGIAGEDKVTEIREQLLAFIKSLVPPFSGPAVSGSRTERWKDEKVDLFSTPPEIALEQQEDHRSRSDAFLEETAEWYPGITWTDWLMLRWISELPCSTEVSQGLIHGIQSRQLYKRIASINSEGPYDALIRKLQELSWPDRIDLCKKLSEQVGNHLKKEWDNMGTTPLIEQTEFDRLCNSSLLMLIDIPRPSRKVGYERPLGIVPELKERSYHRDSRAATEDVRWRKTMEEMIKGIAPTRILCHPKIRNLVSATYAPAESKLAKEIEGILGTK